MSMISPYYVDESDSLAKQFASIVSSYFDDRSAAKTNAARVPLENLFRILEMFRCGSYSDEAHQGVLAVESEKSDSRYIEQKPWQANIEKALAASLTETFGATPKDQAIDDLQSSLRALARNEEVPADLAVKAKGFFTRFRELV